MHGFCQYLKSQPIISQANLFIIESLYSFACWIGHWGDVLKGTSFVPVFQELEIWIRFNFKKNLGALFYPVIF